MQSKNLKKINNRIARANTERSLNRLQLKECKQKIKNTEAEIATIENCTRVIVSVVKEEQHKLKTKVEELMNSIVTSLFEKEDYNFVLLEQTRGDLVEFRPAILDSDKNEYDPEDELGGSIVDLIGLAWKVICLCLERPAKRRILIADEPFRFIGKSLLPKIGDMLNNISSKLGIQIIINTHEDDLVFCGNKVFHVIKANKESTVKEIANE